MKNYKMLLEAYRIKTARKELNKGFKKNIRYFKEAEQVDFQNYNEKEIFEFSERRLSIDEQLLLRN